MDNRRALTFAALVVAFLSTSMGATPPAPASEQHNFIGSFNQAGPHYSVPFPGCDRLPQPPRYPPIARVMGEQGTVTLRLYVGETGSIRESVILRSSGSPRLDDAAAGATRSWRLEPGRQGNRPVAMWTDAIVTFRIFPGAPGTSRVEVRFPMSADIRRCSA